MTQSDPCFNGTSFRNGDGKFISHLIFFKDSKLLQRVGIFRVQPGISEVLLVENTRELG